jgi:hypothetical protein
MLDSMRPYDLDVVAYISADTRSPETIAHLTTKLIDRLSVIHPLLRSWWLCEFEDDYGEATTTPFASIRSILPTVVERNRSIAGGAGERWIAGVDGYLLIFDNDCVSQHSGRDFFVSISAGGAYSNNTVTLTTSLWKPADPALLSFDVTSAVTLAACESFGAMFATVFQGASDKRPKLPGRCMPGSMTYIGPAGAALVTPPPGVFAERRPDGGLLMAATRERFDPDNPDHIAGVRAIHAACAPYNALPEAI